MLLSIFQPHGWDRLSVHPFYCCFGRGRTCHMSPRWSGPLVLIICCWTTTSEQLDIIFNLLAPWLECSSILVLYLIINAVILLIWGASMCTCTCGVRSRYEYSLPRPHSAIYSIAEVHKNMHVDMSLVVIRTPSIQTSVHVSFLFSFSEPKLKARRAFSSSRYSDEKLLAHRLQLVKCL